jgi:hypothetical protein
MVHNPSERLMIEQALRTDYGMCYDSAFVYCLTLDYNGHKDWRLPTLDEYASSNITRSWYEGRECDYFNWAATPVRDL